MRSYVDVSLRISLCILNCQFTQKFKLVIENKFNYISPINSVRKIELIDQVKVNQ